MTIGPKTLVEHNKLHAHALRQLVAELVDLGGGDRAINDGINRVLDDLLVDVGRRVESVKETLAKKEAPNETPSLEISAVPRSGIFEQTKSHVNST
jgi:hypothetical protein